VQRDLHAQRKLSYFEADEPDPENGNPGTLDEDPMLTPEDNLVMRSAARPMPRDRPRPTARGRTRPPSEGLAPANLASRQSIDIVETAPWSAGSTERIQTSMRVGSEFSPRPLMPALSTRASVGGRTHSTADMVSELYSVMSPTEQRREIREQCGRRRW
jgi:hypothetical protein